MANGIALGLSLLAGVWIGWLAAPVVLSILMLLMLLQRRIVWRLLVICALLSAVGALRAVDLAVPDPDPIVAASNGAIGRIISFPRPSGDSDRVLLEMSDLCINEQCAPYSARVLTYLPRSSEPNARGNVIRVEWDFTSASDLERGYKSFVLSLQAIGSARATHVTVIESGPLLYRWFATARDLTDRRLHDLLPNDAGALASGVVTGNDAALSDSAMDAFRLTGTSHITAVSGQNIALIVGFLSLWYAPASPRARLVFHLFLIVVVWMYAGFVGFEPPAQRAAITASLMVLGRHVGRKPDPVTILCLTLGVMAVVEPAVVHGVGYWLSAVSTLALCMLLPTTISGSFRDNLWTVARVPIVASLATMPLTLWTFGSWSPIGLVTNIVLGTLLSLTFPVVYLFALLALISPLFAGWGSFIPRMILELNLGVVHQFAEVGGVIRVERLSHWAMFALCSAVAWSLWLLSGESRRWLRRVEILWRDWRAFRAGA